MDEVWFGQKLRYAIPTWKLRYAIPTWRLRYAIPT